MSEATSSSNHIGTTIPPLADAPTGSSVPNLKKCPFCGNKARLNTVHHYVIMCTGCSASIQGKDLKKTISDWNRRAYPIEEWRSAFAPSEGIQ